MKIERGDSVKFGNEWCKQYGREDVVNKIIKFTPQWFEDDNGIYTYQTECPGIYDKESQEADSIYHLFGNSFEYFMDCELIKGTDKDKEEYAKIIQDKKDEEEKHWNEFVANIDSNSSIKLG